MPNSIEQIEAWLGQMLPEPYRSFLARTASSLLAGNDRTLVFGNGDLVERNETLESRKYCPGHVAIADDSGGSAFILSLVDGRIHKVGMGAMTPDCFGPVAQSFQEWAGTGFPLVGD